MILFETSGPGLWEKSTSEDFKYYMKFSMFECNELVENCFPLFCYAPIGK